MDILILDSKDSLAEKVVNELVNEHKNVNIDYLVEEEKYLKYQSEKVKLIYGNRNSYLTMMELKRKYDVIVDFGAWKHTDFNIIFNELQFYKYIFRSTFMVYGFNDLSRIMFESDINIDNILNLINTNDIEKTITSHELYVREKLLCEYEMVKNCLEKNVSFTIFRPSKIYAEEDYYKDINWIVKRVIKKTPFIIPKNYLENLTFYNPVYVMDCAKIFIKEILAVNTHDRIFNIAQDQILTFNDVVSILAQIYQNEFRFAYVPSDYLAENGLNDYKVPIPFKIILSNIKVKGEFSISFTETDKWLSEICKNLTIYNNETINGYYKEKRIVEKYEKMTDKLNSFKIVVGEEKNEQKKLIFKKS